MTKEVEMKVGSSKPKEMLAPVGKKDKTPYEIFRDIQQGIKVGKSRYNSFSKFNYRSVEDIYEAWKLLNVPLVLHLTDHIIEVGGKVFIESVATVKDLKGVPVESSAAQAELGVGKAGMSSEQATGSASSYARKYALGGLFLLNDSEDPDTPEGEKGKREKKTGSGTLTPDIAAKQKLKAKELQNLIRGDAVKTAVATKELAGRSLLRLTGEEIDEIITAVKSK